MNAQKIFSLGEFFKKLFFMNEGLLKYTLLNRHIILKITVVYTLTDSKNKIVKYYYQLDKLAQSTHA